MKIFISCSICPDSVSGIVRNKLKIEKRTIASQFASIKSFSSFSEVFIFLLLSLNSGPGFRSLSQLVPKLC